MLEKYILTLAVCHSVLMDDRTGNYMSASPDELALVNAAKSLGIEFLRKNEKNEMELKLNYKNGEILKFELLNELEFNSTRKRYSCIVRRPDGQIELFCKGADNVIIDRLKQLDESDPRANLRAKTYEFLESYAETGLRTLLYGSRIIPEDEY
jgi:phospholipid-transporting ATPase